MASAMAGLIAQPSLQGITDAFLPSLNLSSISRPHVSWSLGFTSKYGFGKHTIISGKSNSSHLGASTFFVRFGGDEPSLELGGGRNGASLGGRNFGGGGGGDSYGKGESEGKSPGGIFGAFWKGWNDRVRTDPQFPFKVLMVWEHAFWVTWLRGPTLV